MLEFLHAIIAFPTVLFTAVLGLASLYWIGVILGALDLDLLGGHADAVGGAIKAGAEGAADAVGGAVKAGAEAVGDAVADAAAHAVGEVGHDVELADGAEAKAAAINLLPGGPWLRDAPVTVVLSLVALTGWVLSLLGSYFLEPILGGVLPGWVLGSLVLIGSLAGSIPLAAVFARPFRAVFRTETAAGRAALVGQTCVITTGRVDRSFGQANVDDGQGGYLVQVRCSPEVGLARGDQALIVDYDPRAEVFRIEPLARLDRGS